MMFFYHKRKTTKWIKWRRWDWNLAYGKKQCTWIVKVWSIFDIIIHRLDSSYKTNFNYITLNHIIEDFINQAHFSWKDTCMEYMISECLLVYLANNTWTDFWWRYYSWTLKLSKAVKKRKIDFVVTWKHFKIRSHKQTLVIPRSVWILDSDWLEGVH